MKKLTVILNAAADAPTAVLRDRTPLQAARMPNAHQIAAEGTCGFLRMPRPEAMSSLAFLASVCGTKIPAGSSLALGPIAAEALRMEVGDNRQAWLGRFLTLDGSTLRDAAEPSSVAEQEQILLDLCGFLNEHSDVEVQVRSVRVGLFAILLPKVAPAKSKVLSPMGLLEKFRDHALPVASHPHARLINLAEGFLSHHPINQVRIDLKENPLNGIWVWSGDQAVAELPVCKGMLMASSDPLALGMGRAAGMRTLALDEPYGLQRIDAAFDMGETIRALQEVDDVVVYIPAPFSGGQYGSAADKVKALDVVDYYLIGPLKSLMESMKPSRIALISGGYGHIGLAARGICPVALWGHGVQADDVTGWNEVDVMKGALGQLRTEDLMRLEPVKE